MRQVFLCKRQFDQLDRLTDIGALGGEPGSIQFGGSWTWGGPARLWSFQTKGPLQTGVRLTYLGGPNSAADIPNGAKWQLGSLTWGSLGSTAPTANPAQIWGQFHYGWRGSEGDPRDGAKIGRRASTQGLDLFANMGWSWDYDQAVRLTEAIPGRGSLDGTTNASPDALRRERSESPSGWYCGIRGGRIYRVDNSPGHFKPGDGSLQAAEAGFSQLPSSAFHRNFQGYLPYEH